ncbi:MAG: response regulator [Pseudomonadota bacterium]|nr:response regulator [Pseudomonadota bacterium]
MNAKSPGRDPRALVVDADAFTRRRVADTLTGAGFEVSAVDGADAAFAAFLQSGPFALMVLDVEMQGMGGPQFADSLRDPGRDQPVLFISAGPRPYLHPGQRFLSKGSVPDQLLAAIRRLLDGA